MTNFIRYLKWEIKWHYASALSAVQWFVTMLLPRWLVAMATIRLVAHATTGMYGHTDATNLRIMEAIKRWDTSNAR